MSINTFAVAKCASERLHVFVFTEKGTRIRGAARAIAEDRIAEISMRDPQDFTSRYDEKHRRYLLR